VSATVIHGGMTAFVTDGEQRSALAITRSLGRRGISVIVGADGPASLASASRYGVRHVTYPSPYLHPAAFDRFLLDLVSRERIDVVVPVTDVTTHLVAKNWPALCKHSAAAAPSFEAFDFVGNKMRLVQQAARRGIPVPRTHFIDGAADLEAHLADIEYPAVVKPLRSRIRTDAGWLLATVQYAGDAAALRRLYRDTAYLAQYPSMIQERIVGPGVGVFVLCDRGRLRAAFAHRRLREKPPSGGASVLCESVPLDPVLLDHAMRLLGPLGWHGVAMMEFKQDRRSGTAYLMEVNGRFWGSLHLAVAAGVDFPYLSYRLALGLPIDGPRTYAVGVKSRWLLGDLDHLLLRLCHRNGDQHLPAGAPSRARALLDFCRPGGNVHYDVISPDDPRPFLHEAQEYLRQISSSAAHLGRRVMAYGRRPVLSPAGR
jgi:predicted ATP-grasp superfamily ATP-dependent carboligase